MVAPALHESILKRAQERRLLEIGVHQLRDYATDKHQTTDDVPYGGGPEWFLNRSRFSLL